MDHYQQSRLLSICTNELIPAPNIITFLPKALPFDNEKLPHVSNPTPLQEYFYSPGSALLVNLTAPDK